MTTELLTEEQMLARASTIKPDTNKVVNELEVLFEEDKVFEVNGEKIRITPFKFGQLPAVLKLLRNVGGLYAHYYQQGKVDTTDAIMHIISEAGDDVMQALALNIGKPRSFFDTLDSDVGIEMMIQFLAVNVSFFTKRVMPLLKKTMY
jgi:hypothetical protein